MTVIKRMHSNETWKALAGLLALLAFILLGSYSEALAMQVEYKEAKTVHLGKLADSPFDWYATAHDIANADEVNDYCGRYPDECKDENGELPAMKLCFWHDPGEKTALCHRIETAGPPGYTFQRAESLKLKPLCAHDCVHPYGLVLDARNESFVQGWLGFLSCWVYDPKSRDFVNIFPPIGFTDEGEYMIFRSLGRGIEAVVVEANSIMDWKKETHYGPHKFRISIYKQSAEGYYGEIGSYKTTNKYPSLDDVGSVNVITPELDRIKRFILSKEKKQKR
jgi:hypothetical protein